MKWFTGSIQEAVATSKSRKAVFVVFVTGEDEASNKTAKAIDSPEISSQLEKDDFVAIRLESGSESYRLFAEIYQLVPVPSLFFIGENGTPLDIFVGNLSVSDLQLKIDSVLEKIGKIKSTSNDLIRAEQTAASTQNVPQSLSSCAAAALPQKIASNEPEKPGQFDDSATSTSNDQVEISRVEKDVEKPSDLSKEEKLEHAKKLIELQKQQKAEKDREDEKRRELERRKMGRDVQMARQKQQELEVKLAQEERMREKALEAEAKERVRRQIAQDKLERKQREQAMQQTTQQQSQERVQKSVSVPASGIARIQFRLPSASSHMGRFEATSTLGELRSYVTNNIELPFRQFSLSTSFPRRDLHSEDDFRTLLDLELVPTSVILILPVKSTNSTTVVSAQDPGFLSRLMWAFFSPIFSVYNYFANYFSGPPAGGANQQQNDEPRPSGRAPSPAQSIGQSSELRSRILGGPSSTVTARGNVHRLNSGSDDNDENNTWNGNSTQQM